MWSELWNTTEFLKMKRIALSVGLNEIIGHSPALKSVLVEVERVAPTDSLCLSSGKPEQARN